MELFNFQVGFVSGTKKLVGEEEIKKRKTRFDTGRPEATVPSAVAKPVALMSNLSSASIAAKTTIDAFGSLSKKIKS